MSSVRHSWIRSIFLGGTAVSVGMLICANRASAQPAPQAQPVQVAQDAVPETVIVTGTLFDPDVAPAKASLDTKEPQTIINRSYIEDSVSPTADYVTILAITPSLTGADINGPGLSDGNVKNTLRGLPDGQYGMTYDGIPFGDTNGPTHHSASYFPATTIGSIEVERGPGNAGNLGPATFGGSINLYSEPLADGMRAKGSVSFGSFGTTDQNLNFQSGNINIGDISSTRILFNFQNTDSDGALTLQRLRRNNDLLKIENNLSANWTLTFFANYSKLTENLDDNNGATLAQVATYGKDFALQSSNPNLPTYYQYNVTNKSTDLDYIRLKGNIADDFKVDETVYTYAYVNKTMSPRSILQTITDINNGTAQGIGGKFNPIVGGAVQTNDIPGYQKLNAYRVWGNIIRGSADYQIGDISGQVRLGVWWEGAATQRARFDFDSTLCLANGINPWVTFGTSCQDSSLTPKSAVKVTGQGNPTYNGYAELLEHSGWQQYQPFLEVDFRPIEALTITPGVKYVDWNHTTDSVVEPKLLKPFIGSFRTTRTLPFLEANYKFTNSWSVYAQYAQGIYVPDITAFEQKTAVDAFPKAQTTTNYQVGTVFYADNFTFDADLYYIPVKNNIVFENCSLAGGLAGDTCGVNTGEALYKGIEGETTYAFNDDIMSGALRGLVAFINGSVNSAKSQGFYLKQAPMWTAAAGLVYKRDAFKISLIDKLVGPQYSDNAQNVNYKVHAYNNMDATVGYDFGRFEASVGVYNVLGSRSVLAITENDAAFIADRLLSTDQYYFQAPRSFMVTLKASVSP
ncbi:MAG TPA: TonB-dependent receptor [Micropepsaceae bacterium]